MKKQENNYYCLLLLLFICLCFFKLTHPPHTRTYDLFFCLHKQPNKQKTKKMSRTTKLLKTKKKLKKTRQQQKKTKKTATKNTSNNIRFIRNEFYAFHRPKSSKY